ncbi:MAG: LEA type 2 family protein [Bacteroidota bacterium]
MRQTFRPWILLGLLLALVGQSCRTPSAPELRGISKFKVNRRNAERKVQFQMGLEVYNPNRYRIKLKSYSLKIFLEDVLIGEAQDQDLQVLTKMTATTLDFAVRTDLRKVLGGIGGVAGALLTGKKGLSLRIVGNIRAKAKGIGKTVPVDYVKELPWKEMGLR